MTPQTEPVQLDGPSLQRARALHDDVAEALGELTAMIGDAVDGPVTVGPARIVDKADVVLGGAADAVPVLVLLGPDYCYVYDNTTGQCRPCNASELSSHA